VQKRIVTCHVKISILFILIILIAPGCMERSSAMNSETKISAIKTGGGPCEYKIYEGTAHIISVRKKETPKGYGGPSYESYEVMFVFSTDEEIQELHGKTEGKKYSMQLTNSWYLGPKFLEKYGIEEGKVFDCRLKVILKGTCTPVVFHFPDIDLSDYFETRK
jgi:hypothetical protein